jgi:hypothetical protein
LGECGEDWRPFNIGCWFAALHVAVERREASGRNIQVVYDRFEVASLTLEQIQKLLAR